MLPSPVRLSIVQPLLKPVHGGPQRPSLALGSGCTDAGFLSVPTSLLEVTGQLGLALLGLA